MKSRIIVFLAALVVTGGSLWAEVSFAPIFNNGAVLQCELPVTIWGKADPDATVEVFLDGKKAISTTAGKDGRWCEAIPAHAPGGPHILLVTSGTSTAAIEDIVFGEVWLATGQSNMAMQLKGTRGGEERLAQTIPEIRFVQIPHKFGLPVEGEFTEKDIPWEKFIPGPNVKMSAVAFYFSEKLVPATGRTVGIIQCSVGGTPAQAWTPAWALDERPELKYYADAVRAALASGNSKEQWKKEVDALNVWSRDTINWRKAKQGPPPKHPGTPNPGNPWNPQSPTVLFENMLAAVIPYTARGVIWYQGESNAMNPAEYRVLFPTMIGAWRKLWNAPEWPFLFVQLAAFGDVPSQDWSALRDAQTFTRDTVPQTGMALAIDCGDKSDIHPKAKQPVGERLALLALDQVYGNKVISRGPHLKSASVSGNGVVVCFDFVADGLKASDGSTALPGFELAGADGIFHPASAHLQEKDCVEISADAVTAPKVIRYAWANWVEPPVTLQNSAGLPAEPFQEKVK